MGHIFCASAAFLSAFLDPLTVIVIVTSIAHGFRDTYHGFIIQAAHDPGIDSKADNARLKELKQFRAFPCNLLMHAAIGTAPGGVLTIVGEPQNLLIAEEMGWNFSEFFIRLPYTITMSGVGLPATWLVL